MTIFDETGFSNRTFESVTQPTERQGAPHTFFGKLKQAIKFNEVLPLASCLTSSLFFGQ